MRLKPGLFAVVLVALPLLTGGCGSRSADPFRIAAFGNCAGQVSTTALQQDRSDAGAELPFLRRGAKLSGSTPSAGISDISVGGRRVELLLGCAGFGNWKGDLDQIRRLVEQQGVDAVVLPFSPEVGLALEPYIRKHPSVTFLLPNAYEQTTTLDDPPSNLFRFEVNGAQGSAGLGAYAYRTLGWRNAVTMGAAQPSDWSDVAGFIAEFCALGGNIVQRVWAPPGELNYAPVVRGIRAHGVDGLFYTGGLGGGTPSLASAWRARYPDLARHLLVGTFSLFFDQAPDWLGVVGGSPFPYAPLSSAYTRYAADLKRLTGEDTFLLDTSYYNQTEALLEGLEQVHGETSDGEHRLQQALARLRLETPRGPVTLDARHQGIGDMFLGRLQRDGQGKLFLKQIRVVPRVEQTFNGYFGPTTPPPGPTQPTCRHGNPPPWAR